MKKHYTATGWYARLLALASVLAHFVLPGRRSDGGGLALRRRSRPNWLAVTVSDSLAFLWRIPELLLPFPSDGGPVGSGPHAPGVLRLHQPLYPDGESFSHINTPVLPVATLHRTWKSLAAIVAGLLALGTQPEAARYMHHIGTLTQTTIHIS